MEFYKIENFQFFDWVCSEHPAHPEQTPLCCGEKCEWQLTLKGPRPGKGDIENCSRAGPFLGFCCLVLRHFCRPPPKYIQLSRIVIYSIFFSFKNCSLLTSKMKKLIVSNCLHVF